jgi:hypothetical protein
MSRCSDSRDLAQLDPVTFFIITELMKATEEQREQQRVAAIDRHAFDGMEILFGRFAAKVA